MRSSLGAALSTINGVRTGTQICCLPTTGPAAEPKQMCKICARDKWGAPLDAPMIRSQRQEHSISPIVGFQLAWTFALMLGGSLRPHQYLLFSPCSELASEY